MTGTLPLSQSILTFIHIRAVSALMTMWTVTFMQFCFCDSTRQSLSIPFVESNEVQSHSEHLRHNYYLPSSGVSSTTTLSITHEGYSCMSSEESITLPGRRTEECMVVCCLVSGSVCTESLGTCQPERSTLCSHTSGKTSNILVFNKILGQGILLRVLKINFMKQDQICNITPQNRFKIKRLKYCKLSDTLIKPGWTFSETDQSKPLVLGLSFLSFLKSNMIW